MISCVTLNIIVLQDTHSTTLLSLNMLRLLASLLIEKYGVDPVVESEANKWAGSVQKANN